MVIFIGSARNAEATLSIVTVTGVASDAAVDSLVRSLFQQYISRAM